ncbi:hypothetical protein PAXRUDRAFT_825114 [Paxillus rubicundulus Ve08.2h10]|uniref:Uncharacterized protein n=1 Tax=Paxillus rubicundulus Ve08.2h10 TaxID=930991 RepID=A0A0D0DTK5_9AGAM|nr:hypothetical protein PAXRUDRAFT_825114 [Paxillus rubicundulus Ve08.2h10]
MKLRITRSRAEAAVNNANANLAPTATKPLLPRHTRKILNLRIVRLGPTNSPTHTVHRPNALAQTKAGDRAVGDGEAEEG